MSVASRGARRGYPSVATASPDGGRWFRIFDSRPQARKRLICFPHAGGGASYFRRWSRQLPASVELVAAQYPGREDRLSEPVIDVMERLSAALAGALGELSSLHPLPFAFFGHSMGAVVAYAVCHELERRGERLPEHLVASACEAPTRLPPGELHLSSDERMREELLSVDASSGALAANPELAGLVLPAVRGDYKLLETWRPPRRAPLAVPISAWLGTEDTSLAEEDADAWRDSTLGEFELRRFEGGHFYLMAEKKEHVLRALLQTLAPELVQWPSTP